MSLDLHEPMPWENMTDEEIAEFDALMKRICPIKNDRLTATQIGEELRRERELARLRFNSTPNDKENTFFQAWQRELMKEGRRTILHRRIMSILALFMFASVAFGQVPKRPLGVPADAQHFNGRWYKVVLEKKSWHAARDKCREMGGQLVVVPDEPTWAFIKGLTPAYVWLGATDEVTEGVWKWVDGTDVKYSAWMGKGPDNHGKIEHYLAACRGAWNDTSKTGAFGDVTIAGFVCQWK